MGADSSYYITKFVNEGDAFDEDFFYFRLRKDSAEAKIFIDDEGESTGNDGVWQNFVRDMCAVTKLFPEMTVYVKEVVRYESVEELRYAFRNGQWQCSEPVTTWPDFDYDNWQDASAHRG